MKKTIISFLLGGLTSICIGAGVATSTEILTVKPSSPKSTMSFFGSADSANEKVQLYSSKGYITKAVSLCITNNGMDKAFVVMEKY